MRRWAGPAGAAIVLAAGAAALIIGPWWIGAAALASGSLLLGAATSRIAVTTVIAVAVGLVVAGVAIAVDRNGRAPDAGAGWAVVDGETMAPPVDIEVDGLTLAVGGRVVRRRTVAARARVSAAPIDPADAAGFAQLAIASAADAGGPWSGDVPVDKLASIVAALESTPGVKSVEWRPPLLHVTDASGDLASVELQRPEPATEADLAGALEEEAASWRSLLDAGGALIIDGSRSVEVPPGQADDLGEPALISRGNHRRGRTPRPAEAYLFTPFSAEGVCHTGPLKEAARLHRYRVNHYDGAASNDVALLASSGNAGLLYVCAHGGYGFQLYEDEAQASAASAELEARTGARVPPAPYVTGSFAKWYLPIWRRPLPTPYDGSGTIVWSDGCSGYAEDTRAFFHALEYIGTTNTCYPGSNLALHQSFWGRMAGTVANGADRPVADAFAGMQREIAGFAAEEARAAATFAADVAAGRARSTDRPRMPNSGWSHAGPGTTVLSPAVWNYYPDQRHVLGLGFTTAWVQFDAPVSPLDVRKLVRMRGCGAVVRRAGIYDGGRLVVLQLEVTRTGTATFTVDPFEARSLHDVALRLDGNREPERTDHVGASGDEFTWDVRCVAIQVTTTTSTTSTTTTTTTTTSTPTTVTTVPPATTVASTTTTTTSVSTTAAPTTATTTTTTMTTTTTTVPSGRRRLTVRARSFDQGELPASGITRDPDQPDYANGERVVLTAPESFSSGGFRHFFAEWEVSPRVDFVADGNSISVAMSADVTVTAVYESVPE